MPAVKTASDLITETALTWPGVTTAYGERGELSIRLGKRELGHLHGDHALHIGFRKAVWHDLHDKGWIDYHPVFPGKVGWASRRIETDVDIEQVIEMLRLNYDRGVERHGVPEAA